MHFTYTLYSKDDAVLYVGRTINLTSRLKVFQQRTGVAPHRVEVMVFDTLEESMRDEVDRIDRVRPKYNERRVSSSGAFGVVYSERERQNRRSRILKTMPGRTEASRAAASERMTQLNRESNPSRTAENRERLRNAMIKMNKSRKGMKRSSE